MPIIIEEMSTFEHSVAGSLNEHPLVDGPSHLGEYFLLCLLGLPQFLHTSEAFLELLFWFLDNLIIFDFLGQFLLFRNLVNYLVFLDQRLLRLFLLLFWLLFCSSFVLGHENDPGLFLILALALRVGLVLVRNIAFDLQKGALCVELFFRFSGPLLIFDFRFLGLIRIVFRLWDFLPKYVPQVMIH